MAKTIEAVPSSERHWTATANIDVLKALTGFRGRAFYPPLNLQEEAPSLARSVEDPHQLGWREHNSSLLPH